MARDSYHHGSLRDALLAVARREVAAHGDDALSLRACAREVGVDVAAAYRHFRKKEDVLAAVAIDGFDELGEAMAAEMDAVEDAEPAEAVFLACGRAYVEFGLLHPNVYRLMFGGRCSQAALNRERARRAPAPAAYELLGRALDGLVAAGRMAAENRPGAELFAWSQVHGLVSLAIDGRGMSGPEVARASIPRHIALVARGLCAQGSTGIAR